MQIRKALVVDDSKLARITLTRLLEKRGIAVDSVESGSQALDYLQRAQPDVVFMDFLMPDMNGYDATRSITGNPSTAHIPVVMCTSQDTAEDRARARSHGARGYIIKPATDASLETTLTELAASSTAVPAAAAAKATATPALQALAAEAATAALAEPLARLRVELEQLAREAATQSADARLDEQAKHLLESFRNEVRQLAGEASERYLASREGMLPDLTRNIIEQTAADAASGAASSVAQAAAARAARELFDQNAPALINEAIGQAKARAAAESRLVVEQELAQFRAELWETPQFSRRVEQLAEACAVRAAEAAARRQVDAMRSQLATPKLDTPAPEPVHANHSEALLDAVASANRRASMALVAAIVAVAAAAAALLA
jgi:CheY-like chemotaxis protein